MTCHQNISLQLAQFQTFFHNILKTLSPKRTEEDHSLNYYKSELQSMKTWTGTSQLPTIVFKTILAFVRSVAVHSMNTFFVSNLIAECAPFIIGGKDKTVLQKK